MMLTSLAPIPDLESCVSHFNNLQLARWQTYTRNNYQTIWLKRRSRTIMLLNRLAARTTTSATTPLGISAARARNLSTSSVLRDLAALRQNKPDDVVITVSPQSSISKLKQPPAVLFCLSMR
jgi:hypothetical protein